MKHLNHLFTTNDIKSLINTESKPLQVPDFVEPSKKMDLNQILLIGFCIFFIFFLFNCKYGIFKSEGMDFQNLAYNLN